MLLADMGARVIKIEQPGNGEDTREWGPPFLGRESAYFLSINRNKESVTLDFERAEGRAILAVGNDDQWRRFCRTLTRCFIRTSV